MNLQTRHFLRWFQTINDPEIATLRAELSTSSVGSVADMFKLVLGVWSVDTFGDDVCEIDNVEDFDESTYRRDWRAYDAAHVLFVPLLNSILDNIDCQAAAELFLSQPVAA